MDVALQLFGKPYVKIDQQTIEISLKKSEAMLYYIAYEKRVTRDELVSIIWCDVEQQVAKKNLRNSLYRLKKDLGIELFTCPNKHVIEWASQPLDFEKSDAAFMNQYKGRFLETFSLRESPEFETWKSEVESSLNARFMRLASQTVVQLIEEKAFEEALKLTLTMRKIDEFDESTIKNLMSLYHHLGQYKQISDVYLQFKNLLDEEMGIQPDKSTRDLYYSLIYAPQDEKHEQERYFGRAKESEIIQKALHHTALGQNRQSLILVGEAGVGKTKLLEENLMKYEGTFKVLKMTCYPAESGYAYTAWNDVFSELSSIIQENKIELSITMRQVFSKLFPGFEGWSGHYRTENAESIHADYLEKLICKLFEKLTKEMRLLLYIDDLQWMDTQSLKLLESLCHHVEGFIFVSTLRNGYDPRIEAFIAQLYKYDRGIVLPIDRFSEGETYAFIDYLTEGKLDLKTKERLFQESEGNAFFIVEGAVAMAQTEPNTQHRFKSILDSRFIGVEPGEMKFLVILSMFFDELDFEMLKQLYAVDEDELLEYIQSMKRKYIVKEIEGDESIKIKFTHHKLREHIYEQTPMAKKRILHNRIGAVLEEKCSGDQKDVLLYQKLIYHYSSSGNTLKHLTYYLKYLKAYFDFSHELYPELLSHIPARMDKTPEDYFNDLEALFEKLPADQGYDLLLQYKHLKARYYIRQGHYQEGMTLVEWILEHSSDEEILFKAYVQWFYYLIQTEQVGDMDAVILKMSKLKRSAKNDAVMKRLMGIGSLMVGRYEEARIYFSDSITCFENLGKVGRYVLNIAASYNYISEAYRRQNRLDEALEMVERAIELCRLHNMMRGSSIFNTHAGIIAYDMENQTLAKAYFEEALKNYETVDTLWKRSEAEAYLGIILLKNGHEERGRVYLAKAKEHAHMMGTPETLKLIENLETS